MGSMWEVTNFRIITFHKFLQNIFSETHKYFSLYCVSKCVQSNLYYLGSQSRSTHFQT